MKKKHLQLFALMMSAVTAAVPFTFPASAEIKELTNITEQLPKSLELKRLGYGTVTNSSRQSYPVYLASGYGYTAFYLVFDSTTGFDTVDFHCTFKGNASVGTVSELDVHLNNYEKLPDIPEDQRVCIIQDFHTDGVTQIQLSDFTFTNPDDENASFHYTVYAWNPTVSVRSVYTGRYDSAGNMLDMIEPAGTVPEYQLAFSEYPQITYTQGETFDVTKLPVHLVATTPAYIRYYDVSEYLYTAEPVSLDQIGTQTIHLESRYRTNDGGGAGGLSLDLPIEVVAPGETTPTLPVLPVVTVRTETKPYSDVTMAYEDPQYTPWFTDAEGHTFNKGTNAFCKNYLKIITMGQTEFAVGEEFTTAGIKVFLVEDRTHNDLYYDVTDHIHVKTNYNPDVPGTYTVEITSDFVGNEGMAKEPVTYEVEVKECMTTGPKQSGTEIFYTETTTETTAVKTETVAGDANRDNRLNAADAVLVSRFLTGEWIPAEENAAYFAKACDLFRDDMINAKDLTKMKYLLVKGTK